MAASGYLLSIDRANVSYCDATLNGAIALILRYFTEFDSFAGRLHHSG